MASGIGHGGLLSFADFLMRSRDISDKKKKLLCSSHFWPHFIFHFSKTELSNTNSQSCFAIFCMGDIYCRFSLYFIDNRLESLSIYCRFVFFFPAKKIWRSFLFFDWMTQQDLEYLTSKQFFQVGDLLNTLAYEYCLGSGLHFCVWLARQCTLELLDPLSIVRQKKKDVFQISYLLTVQNESWSDGCT